MYGEDIDLSYRLVLGGYKNYYIPERILHYKGESTSPGDIKYVKAFYGAMLIFFRKYYPRSGHLMSFFIRLAILFRASLAMLSQMLSKRTSSGGKHRRLLIMCREENFKVVKAACIKHMPNLEYVNLWDLSKEHVMSAICRRNQMKAFTDYAFCHPDTRFEQILLFMDKQVNKKATFHIYSTESGQLISPGRK